MVHALHVAISAARESGDFETIVSAAIAGGGEPALQAALAGSLAGAFHGASVLPMHCFGRLQRRELLEEFAARLAGQQGRPETLRPPRVTDA